MAEPTTTNGWCRPLDIVPPRLEAIAGHREANTYALLIVALLERGEPMTLADVAARFEEAGVAERSRALLSLQRCKPGRTPVYREGDLYHLDPHEPRLNSWVVRLGLRPPKFAPIPSKVVEAVSLPGPDTALTVGELDEAWKDASLFSWAAKRLAIAVLDAHGGPLAAAEVVAAVAERTEWHMLTEEPAKFSRRGSAVDVLPDGRWAIAADEEPTVRQVRSAVRERVARARQRAEMFGETAVFEQRRAKWEGERAAGMAELARLSRAFLVAFPPDRPAAVALLDVAEHEITTFVGDELSSLPSRLATFDILGGIDVRRLLGAVGSGAGEHRLAELGPPQKTKKLNQQGRTLKITTALLVQGSCGISKPFGDPKKLAEYLAKGAETKLRRRLEADVKSLYALYEYGCLHRTVRLRWGFLDERIPAPWVHYDQQTLYDLKRSALAMNVPLEVVVGSAPGWGNPWSRVRLAYVEQGESRWSNWLVDEYGYPIDEREVQRARLSVAVG